MKSYNREDIDRSWYEWEQRNNSGCFGSVVTMCLVVLLVLMCASCGTTRIEYRDRIVDNIIKEQVHDTLRIEVKDSTYHTIIQKGDTVYDTKYIERTRWRDRIVERTDTCWRDSVVTEYKETVKEVTKIPKIFWFSMIFSIIYLIFVGVKIYRWFTLR